MGKKNEKLTTEAFIEKSIEIHTNKYDYSNTKFIKKLEKVKIICPEHGEFEQTAKSHLLGHGCPKCGNKLKNINRTLSTSDFIKRVSEKHNNKYNYCETIYINSHTKIKIICPEHGEFEQRPYRHICGDGCPKCAGRNKNIIELINKANEKHNNKYEYDITLDNIINNDKGIIICPEHGEFKQKLSNHLNGQGCPKCVGLNKTSIEFINESKKIHNNKYDYSKINYKSSKFKVKIICPEHGEFEQTPNNHLNGQGCPICRESKGERKIRSYLNLNNIRFEHQYKFKDCKNKNSLPFDFYLPDYNICVEYDGIQHFKPISRFGGKLGFEKLLINDKLKNNFCEQNKIKLIRVSYLDDIKKKLEDSIY